MSVSTRASVLAVLAVAVAAAIACSGSKPAQEQAQVPEPVKFPAQPVGPYMHDHFSRVALIRDAIIRADLEDAKDPATWIADHEQAPGLPESSAAQITAMKASAKTVADAAELNDAAAATASLVAVCGNCHAAMSAKVPVPSLPEPIGAKDAKAQMVNHRRAMELLYDGLVVPAADAWSRGCDALKTAPLSSPVKDAKLRAEVQKLVAQAKTLAGEAVAATDEAGRAKAYGALLGTCGNCHRLQGIVIGTGFATGGIAGSH